MLMAGVGLAVASISLHQKCKIVIPFYLGSLTVNDEKLHAQCCKNILKLDIVSIDGSFIDIDMCPIGPVHKLDCSHDCK